MQSRGSSLRTTYKAKLFGSGNSFSESWVENITTGERTNIQRTDGLGVLKLVVQETENVMIGANGVPAEQKTKAAMLGFGVKLGFGGFGVDVQYETGIDPLGRVCNASANHASH